MSMVMVYSVSEVRGWVILVDDQGVKMMMEEVRIGMRNDED
jgi:hypothetical protein